MLVCGIHCRSTVNAFFRSVARDAARTLKRWLIGAITFLCVVSSVSADEVFIYSTGNVIRGINIDMGVDWVLTTAPFTPAANALGFNAEAGFVYYGDDTSVYRWDPALGNNAAAHSLMNDFAFGPVTAPIRNLNSTAGAYRDGIYYVGSEDASGNAEEIWALTLSFDGSNVVSAQPLDLLAACNCTAAQLGGFGDVAALTEGGLTVLYGATTDITGNGGGIFAGRWRFTPATGDFTLLQAGPGGQMSGSLTNRLYSNVGNSIREVDITTGIISNVSLFTSSAAIFDFSGGFSMDFGDAPDSYGAAFHRVPLQNPTAYIGNIPPDNEPGSLNTLTGSVDGDGDDATGVDDEDAVNNLASIDASVGDYSVSVSCSAGTSVAAWLDMNINGVFDGNERNSNHPVSCVSGQATLQWLGIGAAVEGDSYLRFRASDNVASISSPIGISSNGEVEDHPVTIVNQVATSGGTCLAGQSSHVYTQSDLPQQIGPREDTVTVSTITVPDSFTVEDVNVIGVQGTYTRMRDLVFDLRHSGVTQRLYGPSCNLEDDFFISFDDQSSGTPPCAPTDGGTYPPVESLSVYNGVNSTGQWELRVTDQRNGRRGTFQNWSLELCSSGTPAVVPDARLGKIASVVDREVTMSFRTVNTGGSDLSDIQIVDDLDAVFGTGNYTISATPSFTTSQPGFTINTAFDGTASNNTLLATSGTLAPGAQLDLQFSVQVDVIAATATPGDYTNQADLTAIASTGDAVNDLSGNSLDLTSDTDIPTTFSVDRSASLSGFIFEDTGLDISTAHDGVFQAGEAGIANRVVEVFDPSGLSIGVAQTDATGQWQINIDEAFLDQALTVRVQTGADYQVISESALYANGSIIDGELVVSLSAGESVSDVNTGLIDQAEFTANQSSAVSAGNSTRYAHVFRSPSFGELSFTLTSSVNPATPAWTNTLLRDNNCNGVRDAGDFEILAPVTVVPGEDVCLLLDVFVPSNAVAGASSNDTLSADLQLADDANTGHGLSFQLDNNDVTTALSALSGRLVLEKTVRNLTLGEAPGTNNSGLPGHTLEYIISYRNTGPGQITDLEVNDALPAFTTAVGGSVVCDTTPANLACTPAIAGDALSWTFTGSLLAGETGSVRYQVLID